MVVIEEVNSVKRFSKHNDQSGHECRNSNVRYIPEDKPYEEFANGYSYGSI
jgi:hypothetical protein